MKTLHQITRHSDQLSGDFQILDCTVQAPELEGIEPIVETFIPAGPGKINNHAVLAWRNKEGGYFTAQCQSQYRLAQKRRWILHGPMREPVPPESQGESSASAVPCGTIHHQPQPRGAGSEGDLGCHSSSACIVKCCIRMAQFASRLSSLH